MLANLGEPDGMLYYRTMVSFEIGIQANEEEGVHWLLKAYKMGILDALIKLKTYNDILANEMRKV